MAKLEGKVAIITGGTSGIGTASAELFATEGAKVVVVGRNQERGQKVVDEIKEKGGEAIFFQADMNNSEDLDALLKTTIDTYGKLDILFNNAGVVISGPLESFKDEDWDFVLKTNLRAPYIMSKKAIPYLRETKGNILNTASMAGLRSHSNGYAYNTSKSGLIMLTQVIARDFAPEGIRCNAICPGITQTPILGTVKENEVAAICSTIPLQRMCDPMEIPLAVIFHRMQKKYRDKTGFIPGVSEELPPLFSPEKE
jgi:meso-butanediol dehydrogenase/(S,S)-butanediol dehydrogenase/diacetyl reductase